MISKQMKMLIEQKKTIDPHYDEAVEKNWQMMTEVMCVNVQWTIAYLDVASEEEIHLCSEVWEEVSAHWKSDELIEAMERCKGKFPSIAADLELEINYAKKAMGK